MNSLLQDTGQEPGAAQLAQHEQDCLKFQTTNDDDILTYYGQEFGYAKYNHYVVKYNHMSRDNKL